MKLFSLDSPIGRAVALIADLVVLNMLFLFSCMPIVTIGAACGALYDTVNSMLMGTCPAVSRTYFAGFKKCFKRGTVLFLISALVLAVILADLILAVQVSGIMGLLCTGVITGSLVITLAVMAHLPGTLCRSPEDKTLELVKRSLLLAVKNGWRSIMAAALNVLPFGLFYFAPALFLRTWMFWFLLGAAAVAYVNNWLLLKNADPEAWDQLRPVK